MDTNIIQRKEDVNAIRKWLLEKVAPEYYLTYVAGVTTGARAREMIAFFRSNCASHITQNGFLRVLASAAKECKVPCSISTHTPRKTFGYLSYSAGVSLDDISKKLGHNDAEITKKYLGL